MSPLVGVAVDEAQLGVGDFLMRNVLSLDRTTGALAIGAVINEGQPIQFNVRDAASARKELRTLLQRNQEAAGLRKVDGALLFSCVGRGRSFFGSRGHDSEMFSDVFPDTPLGGCFCNGEIGPVRGNSQLHGYSSSFGLFRRKDWD
jgi:small ligand-binding sensory domain FIST